jgi:hypothetical protein
VAVFTLTSFVISGAWAAADAEKEAKHEMRKMQAQLSAAQKEKTDLATQLEELKKQLGDASSKSAALEKKSGGQKKQFAELTAKLQESDTNLQKMTQQESDTNTLLQQVQKEKELLKREKEQEQKRLSGDIRLCEKKNTDLYRISTDLLEKYQSKGFFTALLQAEPFTQLEKVKFENLAQEYKEKIDAAKLASAQIPVTTKPSETLAISSSSSQPVVSPSVKEGGTQSSNKPDLAKVHSGDNNPQSPVNQSNNTLGNTEGKNSTTNPEDKTVSSNPQHASQL